jgi:hypothetical protein
MSKNRGSMVLACILLLAIGYLAGTFSVNPVYADKKIKYKVVRPVDNLSDPKVCQSILDKMAADGWEYYANLPASPVMIFKK